MKYERTRSGYLQYLESEHWDMLRTCVLERDGHKCVRCGSSNRLQAHHKFYRDDWEQAQPGDLETLCKSCHEKEHPDKQSQVKDVPVETLDIPFLGTRKAIEQARSQLRISREEYVRLREKLLNAGRWGGGKQRKRNKHRRRNKPKRSRKVVSQGCKPWYYSPRRMHWVNRDRSSN